MQIKRPNLIVLEEIQTIDLRLDRLQARRRSAALLDRQVGAEDLCLKMKYHLRSYSIDSLEVV